MPESGTYGSVRGVPSNGHPYRDWLLSLLARQPAWSHAGERSRHLQLRRSTLRGTSPSPALPFYVGKGAGTRSFDHLAKPDATRKGLRIQEIHAAGAKVLVTRLVESLTETQAIKLEAELISAFGTVDTGGLLTNSVLPSGLSVKSRAAVVLPSGVREKAQLGLALLKDAVLEFAKVNPRGISNSDAASLLGLRSDYGGGSKDYLSYSVIGILMREGKLERDKTSKKHVARVE
jgi:uncharacterized protein